MSSRYSALGRWGGVWVALAWDFPICYLKYVLFTRQKQSQMFRGSILKGPTLYHYTIFRSVFFILDASAATLNN